MIKLLVDAAVALVNLSDRGLTALENVFRLQSAPLVVDGGTPPAGPGPASAGGVGAGGHSPRTTSALLYEADGQFGWAFQGNPPAVIRALRAELRDRAAQFAAIGD